MLAVFTLSTLAQNSLTNGLVAYYPFDSNANDASGNGNNGTVHGALYETNSSGQIALSFNGINDYVSLTKLPTSGSGNFSIFAWINDSSPVGTRQSIVSYGQTSAVPHAGLYLYLNTNNKLQFDLTDSSGPISSKTINHGEWRYVGVVNTGGNIQLYVDGVADGSPFRMSPNITPFYQAIGAEGGPGAWGNFFNGLIDDVRIYNRALSVAEVQQLFNLSVSGTLSTVTVSPGSTSADGVSAITATVTLRDAANEPVSGDNTYFYAQGSPVNIAQPSNPTDSNGQAIARLTASTPGTATIWAFDTTQPTIVQPPATVQFTNRQLVLPNADLANAIAELYQVTTNALIGPYPSIASISTNLGYYGDQFRADIAADDASAVFDAVVGTVGLVEDYGDVSSAKDVLLPGVEETGNGLNVESGQVSALLDTDLEQSTTASSVAMSPSRQLLKAGLGSAEELLGDADEDAIESDLDQYFALRSDGPSWLGSQEAQNCTIFQQALQSLEQSSLNTGIPPLTASQQTAWANDLQSRYYVGLTLSQVLQEQATAVSVLAQARAESPGNTWEFLTAKTVASGLAGYMDGWGGLIINGSLLALDEYNDFRNLSGDQLGFGNSVLALNAGVMDANQTYLNAASAFTEISQARLANPVTGQIGPRTDWEEGYDTWGPLHVNEQFTATNAYSFLVLTNTSPQPALFEVLAVSLLDTSAYGVSVKFMPLVSTVSEVIPANGQATVQITYYDGQNGAKPDVFSSVVVWVLGNNASGTFYIGAVTQPWNPTQVVNGSVLSKGSGPMPMDGSQEIENPVTTYVTQDPTNQSYQDRIFVVNPYAQTYSAIVTQALPPGITNLTTDGTLTSSAIVWTNLIPAGSLIKDSFTFCGPFAPGAATNLAVPVVTFVDQTNNPSSPFYASGAGFTGLFPVGVNGSIPAGVAGTNVPMQLVVTNWMSTNQTGVLTISLTDPSGNTITNFSQSFSVNGSSSTNVNFTLPGSLPAGSYSLTGSLSINGGTGQVLAGTYVVPMVPIILGFSSTPPLNTNGFNLMLQGPVGNYLIEASSDISNPTNWQPVLFYTSTNSPFHYNFTDPAATNFNQRFYRAVLP